MPVPTALANEYSRCKLIKLGEDEPLHGPFAITQTACDPEDPRMAEIVFLLSRRAVWVDQLALAKVPEERQLDFIFGTSAEALKTISELSGAPVIERYELTEDDLRERVAAWQGGSFQQRVKALVARFRASQPVMD